MPTMKIGVSIGNPFDEGRREAGDQVINPLSMGLGLEADPLERVNLMLQQIALLKMSEGAVIVGLPISQITQGKMQDGPVSRRRRRLPQQLLHLDEFGGRELISVLLDQVAEVAVRKRVARAQAEGRVQVGNRRVGLAQVDQGGAPRGLHVRGTGIELRRPLKGRQGFVAAILAHLQSRQLQVERSILRLQRHGLAIRRLRLLELALHLERVPKRRERRGQFRLQVQRSPKAAFSLGMLPLFRAGDAEVIVPLRECRSKLQRPPQAFFGFAELALDMADRA
jgi:hypothetical protein